MGFFSRERQMTKSSDTEDELSLVRMTEPLLPHEEPAPHAAQDGVKDFVAGGVGGIMQLIVGHPLDTMKVKMQTTEMTGLGEVARHIMTQDGLKGFYRGVASPFLGFTALNAVLFSSYGAATRMVRGDIPEDQVLPYSRVFVAGMMAGTCASMVKSPMDLFKAKMQSQKPDAQGQLRYRNTGDCVMQIARQRGIRGVYQGLHATWARNIPANACYFLGYEWMKRTLTPAGAEPSAMALLMAGGFSGVCFWALCFPMDVVKTVLQTDASTPAERTYKGYFDCVRRIYARGGLTRFYAGFAPGVLRAFPANAACFFGYEFTKKHWPQ